MSAHPSITCPKCHRTSYNEGDIRTGYCGFCHDFTSDPTRPTMTPHEEAVALLHACGAKLKILPGDQVPAAASWHVCTLKPCSPTNHVGNCSQCGQPVYFSDSRPTLKKICIQCVLKYAETNEVEAYGNTAAIIKAVLHGKQN